MSSNRIIPIMANLQFQARPLITRIKESLIDDSQIQQILRNYWTPTERIQKGIERIVSGREGGGQRHTPPSPLSTLPPPPEANALRELSAEVGEDVSGLLRSVSVMFELLPEKVVEINELEKQLKETDSVIERYQNLISRFSKDIDEFSRIVPLNTVPETDGFLETLNENLMKHLMEMDVPRKMERYQFLLSQISAIRAFIELIHRRTSVASNDRDDGERMPLCKVCLDRPVEFVMTPCGHMCCEICMNRIHETSARCYFCRRDVADIHKVFM